jgi:hypothetical protein
LIFLLKRAYSAVREWSEQAIHTAANSVSGSFDPLTQETV